MAAETRSLSVYDGGRLLGFVVIRGATFLAIDPAGREVGTFTSQKLAVAAL